MAGLFPLLGLLILVFAMIRGVGNDMRDLGRLSESTANIVAMTFLLVATVVFVASGGHVLPIAIAEPVALAVGVPLLITGLFLAAAASHALQSRERLLGMRIDTVVTTGIYAISRHPFYIGSTLALVGSAIAGRSWLALSLAIATALLLRALARNEERVLSQRFEDAYPRYQDRTRRMLGRRAVATSSS